MLNYLKNWIKKNWKSMLGFCAGIFILILIKENILNLSYPAWGYFCVGGIDFDTDDVVTIPDSDDFTVNQLTVSARIFIEDITRFRFFSKDNVSSDREWAFITINKIEPGDGVLTGVIIDNSTGGYIERNAVATLSPNTWYHVVLVWTGGITDDAITLYVNGSIWPSVGAGVGSFVAMRNTSSPVRIGQQPVPGIGFANGIVDEVDVWRKALTANEVNELFIAGQRGYGEQIQSDFYVDGWALDDESDGKDASNDTVKSKKGTHNGIVSNTSPRWTTKGTLSYPGLSSEVDSGQITEVGLKVDLGLNPSLKLLTETKDLQFVSPEKNLQSLNELKNIERID